MELLHAIHDMEFRTEHDIPSSEPPTQDPFEMWLQRQLQGAGKSPSTFWIALDGGRPVAVARLRVMPGRAAGNGLTAVDADYRGRGIARALKFKTIEWARENGIETIYTENDLENHRMLAINVSLGYKPLPPEVELVKDLPV
jgi:RimJ/RimL family protein N-acetyltransferase